jgi:anion-transporting  ArsA/GET3 family ATPase
MRPRIAVCVGCGGVGKTTIAAALGVEAARRGRRALVLTIDPARRRPVLARLGVPEDGGLAAMMLDMKRTFDDLVERFAESPEARDRIFSNAIYQHASDALAGSVEYSAMEKVYELYEGRQFDLIVVDTPPAQHALDFLGLPRGTPASTRIPGQPSRADPDPPRLRSRALRLPAVPAQHPPRAPDHRTHLHFRVPARVRGDVRRIP